MLEGVYQTTVGTYTDVFTGTDGCDSIVVTMLTVTTNLLPDFSATNGCLSDSTLFIDQSTAGSGTIIGWNWNFGDGATSTLQDPAHQYSAAGTYNSQLTVTSSSGCSDSIVQIVTVNPGPLANFMAGNGCVDDTILFTDLSSISSGNIIAWAWDLGDGNTSSLLNASHVYSTSGSYAVQLTTTSDSGCTSSFTQTITVMAVGTAGINLNICEGDSTMLSGVYQTTAGIYTDTLTGPNGCDSIITTTLTVDPAPNAGLNNADTVCHNQTTVDLTTILAGTPDAGGSWSDDDNSGALNGNIVDASITGVGTYDFTYTVPGIGACADVSATVTLIVEVCGGVQEFSSSSWKVYPNPTTGKLSIDMGRKVGSAQIDLHNLLGQLIQRSGIIDDQTLTIELQDDANGVYYLRVATGEDVRTFRVMVVE